MDYVYSAAMGTIHSVGRKVREVFAMASVKLLLNPPVAVFAVPGVGGAVFGKQLTC